MTSRRITGRSSYDCISAVENRTEFFYQTTVLVKLAGTVTDMNRSHYSCNMREKNQFYIGLVVFVYLESMLTDFNWSQPKANSTCIVSVPVCHESTNGKV